MQPGDVRNLIRFNTRMGMFICPSTRSNIESFLHGFEYGTTNCCRFTELLGTHLAKEYRIKADALGWPHQIARLAEKHSLDWMDVYLITSSEVLFTALRQSEAETRPGPVADPARLDG